MLQTFDRNFMRISVFLIGKERLSEQERNRWYLQSFYTELRDRIIQRLAIVQPNVNPDDSYPYNEINKAAVFILNSLYTDSPNPYAINQGSTGIRAREPTPAPSTTIVKTETYDADLLRQIQVQLNNLTQVATTLAPNRSTNNVQMITNPPAAPPAANQFGHL
jgi:hypothetical protein